MSPFKDGEVVWVKWGSCWWPGEVWSDTRVPGDILTSLRKPVIAFVKFFQEESFEFVRNLNNIMKYDCDQKMDHVKKGMDKYKASKKMMTNFPADVVKAEQLTGGNINILSNLETPTKSAPSTPAKSFEASPAAAITKKPAGAYNSSTKVQLAMSPAPKSDKKFTCTMCNFATDRMNLLMFHIKNHSSTFTPRVSDPAPFESKKTSAAKSPAKKANDDSIADDVRKIKESMKKEKEPKVSTKKTPKVSTVIGRPSRGARKEAKVEEPEKKVEELEKKIEEKPKPEPVNELKNELLADWMDDDDAVEKEKVEELPKPLPIPQPIAIPTKSPEKTGETSRSIRNIPKKQRISEVYIQPEPVKVEEPVETPKIEIVPLPAEITSKKPTPKASKRKNTATTSEIGSDTDAKKLVVEANDDSLLMATAELLNETEVPKEEGTQLPSPTFHKSNDIDKRNLPPKERNKRFRAKITEFETQSNNGTTKEEPISSPIQNELMLPHKKKQSSRLLTAEKPEPAAGSRSPRRKLKSGSDTKPVEAPEVEVNNFIDEKPEASVTEDVQRQSPLREIAMKVATPLVASPKRGQKRHNSDEPESAPEPKKLQKSDSETSQGRTIVACASEACINSKGELSVAHRDSQITTQAHSVMVTSHVVITESAHQPLTTTEIVSTPKTTIKIPAQSLKNALKVPAEKLLEMKKQGLVKVGLDMKNKLTEKGKQMFKETQSKSTEERSPTPPPTQVLSEPEPERTKSPEMPSQSEPKEVLEPLPAEEAKVEPNVEEKKAEPAEPAAPNGDSEPVTPVEESTNKQEVEKEPIITAPASPAKESVIDSTVVEPVENGKDPEADSSEDPNSGGAGLIALQAETFGGPPNCFYLCRQVEDRYEPVDNQILVLNAQNALVPYEGGDVSAEDALATTEVAPENLAAYPQLSPNSNIIINTPNGQKIELNHFTILALQEQADENGNASIELSGEQLELNINMILEAISAQQQQEQADVMLVDGEGTLMLDPVELPVEIHHSATQVSETLTKPIMSTTVAPEICSTKVVISDTVSKNLNIDDSLASIGVTTQPQRSNIPKSLELPITVTNPTIAETANHRKLAIAPLLGDLMDVATVASDSFVVQSAADNGSED